MVAVDAQILGGVAVTVLLALLFFGVVVLWDVALALRGVADKVDKLEDTLDDDLTDLERAVDGSPGGGGAQVHLNGGGTITPGSAGAGAGARAQSGHPGRAARGPADGAGRTGQAAQARSNGPAQPNERAESDIAGEAKSESAAAEAATVGTAGDQAAPNTGPDEPEASSQADRSPEQPSQSREAIGADPTPVRDASAEGTETSSSARARTGSDADESETDDADSNQPHPDASMNQGRFIASPDRTAWYRTPLDREAIAEARSPIAGELEAATPSREADDATDETEAAADEEPIVVGPNGPDDTVSGAESPDGERQSSGSDRGAVVDETEADPSTSDTDGSAAAEADRDQAAEGDGESGPSQSDDGLPAAESTDEGPDAATDELETGNTGDSGLDTVPTDDEDSSDDAGNAAVDSDVAAGVDEGGEEASEAEGGEPSAGGSPASPSGDSEPADAAPSEVDTADSQTDGRASAVPGTDSATTVTENPAEGVEADAPDEMAPADEPPERSAAESDAPFEPDQGMEFTFEEFTPEESPEPELTVDDAVDAVNDETPALSRSANGVQSSAEVDDEGVVLVYDLEDSEASGSTTRLLRYQLQSFAAESDAEVDVTVSGNRIVVDIPGAEGSDVSQWQSAIVEVIDRTLYLSDNSE